jgi:hypothetical protein
MDMHSHLFAYVEVAKDRERRLIQYYWHMPTSRLRRGRKGREKVCSRKRERKEREEESKKPCLPCVKLYETYSKCYEITECAEKYLPSPKCDTKSSVMPKNLLYRAQIH